MKVQIADIATVGTGQGAPQNQADFSNVGTPFIRAGSLEKLRAGAGYDVLERVTDLAAKEYRLRLYPKGTIVFAKSGMSATMNRIFELPAPAFVVNHLATLESQRDVDSTFLKYFWQYYNPARLVQDSGYPSIIREAIESVWIDIPPLPEQRRIAALLDKADYLRRTRRYAAQLSDTFLQAVFVQMFGDTRTNPMGWDVETLEDLETKFDYGTSAKCTTEQRGLPVLRIPNILHGDIDLSDLKYAELPDKEARRLLLAKGELIFVRTNGNPDYVGRCAVFNLDAKYLFASYLIRAKLDTNKLIPLFVQAHLITPAGRKAMSPFIRTTAGQSNIGTEGLGQIPIPLPPLALQEEFARTVQQFERLRAQQRETERQAEHLFQTLLHRAFGGEG